MRLNKALQSQMVALEGLLQARDGARCQFDQAWSDMDQAFTHSNTANNHGLTELETDIGQYTKIRDQLPNSHQHYIRSRDSYVDHFRAFKEFIEQARAAS